MTRKQHNINGFSCGSFLLVLAFFVCVPVVFIPCCSSIVQVQLTSDEPLCLSRMFSNDSCCLHQPTVYAFQPLFIPTALCVHIHTLIYNSMQILPILLCVCVPIWVDLVYLLFVLALLNLLATSAVY